MQDYHGLEGSLWKRVGDSMGYCIQRLGGFGGERARGIGCLKPPKGWEVRVGKGIGERRVSASQCSDGLAVKGLGEYDE